MFWRITIGNIHHKTVAVTLFCYLEIPVFHLTWLLLLNKIILEEMSSMKFLPLHLRS